MSLIFQNAILINSVEESGDNIAIDEQVKSPDFISQDITE